QPLDRGDVGALGLYRVLRAAAHGPAVHEHGAGAAHAVLAADVHAVELQLVAQEIAQQHARLGVAHAAASVDGQLDAPALVGAHVQRLHAPPSPGPRAPASARVSARRINASASARRYAPLAT